MPSVHDLEQLALALSSAFPNLDRVAPLKIVGEGFRSLAVATADSTLIRIGKTQEAADGFALETTALPLVKQHVSAPVPDPILYVTATANLPFGALGYPKLHGWSPEPGDPRLAENFIPELASFLIELHAIPTEEADSAGVRSVDSHARLLGAKPVVMPVLQKRVGDPEFRRLEEWWSEIERLTPAVENRFTVCHPDLWYENLLVDERSHLSGVLDWSHIEIGDPMHDFAAIHHFGLDLTEQFIDTYQSIAGALTKSERHRVELFWQGRDVGGLAWAIENNNVDETTAAIGKVLAGPIFN